MSYILIKTIGRKKSDLAHVEEIDEEIALKTNFLTLLNEYHELYWIVTNTVMDNFKVQSLNIEDLPIAIQISTTKTFADYLKENENLTIPTRPYIPHYYNGEGYAWDVASWEFEYKAINKEMHIDATIPDDDKHDLLLSCKYTDYATSLSHSLISINGFLHRHEPSPYGWIIHDGNKTWRRCRDKMQMSVIDFTQLGSIRFESITEDMIRPAIPASPLKDNIYINLKEELVGKTIMLSLGGYLHYQSNVFSMVSNQVMKIDFNHIRWESLYYKMKEYLDLSSFDMTDYGDDRVIGFELYSDHVIKALLTLPQTFLIIIDNPYIGVEYLPIGHTGIPGRYEMAYKPIYPLRIAEGRYQPYKAIKEIDKWSIAVDDNISPHQVRYQQAPDDFHMIHNRIWPTDGEQYSHADIVRFYSDRLIDFRDIEGYQPDGLPHYNNIDKLTPEEIKENLFFYSQKHNQHYMTPKKIIDEDFYSEYYTPIFNV